MASRVTRSASKAAQSTRRSASPPAQSPSKRSRPTSSENAAPATPKRTKRQQLAAEQQPDSPYVPPTPNTEKRIHDLVESAEQEGEKEGAVLLHPDLTFRFEDAKEHLEKVDPRWGAVIEQLPQVSLRPLLSSRSNLHAEL